VTTQQQGPRQIGPTEQVPEDIKLGEAGRNWVARQSAVDPQRPIRRLAADAAVSAAIAQAYGAD
jgi:hypothetical protein